MAAGEYTIRAEQGASFLLFLEYQDDSGGGISLKTYKSAMQVRRSIDDPDMVLHVTGSTVDQTSGNVHTGSLTGGGLTGEFGKTGGVSGTGQIKLDVSAAGATGTTGGILVTIDGDTMANTPSGDHFYDLEISSGVTINKILRGRFEITPEVTR